MAQGFEITATNKEGETIDIACGATFQSLHGLILGDEDTTLKEIRENGNEREKDQIALLTELILQHEGLDDDTPLCCEYAG